MAESFASALAASGARTGAPSKLLAIRSQMKPKDAAELDAALADRSVSAYAIGRALRALGFDVADTTVSNWARRARG